MTFGFVDRRSIQLSYGRPAGRWAPRRAHLSCGRGVGTVDARSASLNRRGLSASVARVSLRNFRYVALLEATSFLLLLVASYVKHFHEEEIGVTILGPIHGVLFIAYVLMALGLRSQQRWDVTTTVLILLGAVVPFGGYVVDRWLARNPPAETA